MPLIWAILSMASGFLLLALAVFFRLGRTAIARDWADQFGSTATNVLLLLPGAGIFLLGLGMSRWVTTVPGALGMVVLMPIGAILVLWGGFFDVPMWAVPRWARETVSRRRQQTRGTWKG